MKEKRYFDAMSMLCTLKHLQRGASKLNTIGQIIICQAATEQFDPAIKLQVSETVSLLKSDQILQLPQKALESCNEEAEKIVNILKDFGMINDAVTLNCVRRFLAHYLE